MFCKCGEELTETRQAVFGQDTVDYYICKCGERKIFSVTNKEILEVHADMAHWKDEMLKAQKNNDSPHKIKCQDKLIERQEILRSLKNGLKEKYRGKV